MHFPTQVDSSRSVPDPDGVDAQRMPGRKGSSGTGVRYKLTLATGLLECLCFAGVVFGWASLVFVLKTDGYFSDLCINATDASGELGTGEVIYNSGF